ncbi:MAG: nucleotidyl transferase AbiEii/AbiGii toxin family protein [Verrucomicrobiae bacterium]|nr:nucleotidyl transferase AbiEii/AbiGii toxin family protein [Verrucomicrobiae bacterium]
MNLVFQAAEALQSFLKEQQLRFCFIGGLALQHWGEPRVTRDVDATVFVGFGNEEALAKSLFTRFSPRVADFWEKALRARVALLVDANGVGLDVAFGALPFEERMVQRSQEVRFLPDWSLRICSAEDLIVTKALAGRARDWLDVETIIIRQGSKLDWAHILRELTPLAELAEKPELLGELERLRRKVEKK